MLEQRAASTVVTDEITDRSVTIFFEPHFRTITGQWYWDVVCDSIFCSNVMFTPDFPCSGTQGIIHPDDVEAVQEKIRSDKLTHLEFRVITTYGEVKTLAGHDLVVHSRPDLENQAESRIRQLSMEAADKKDLEQLTLIQQIRENVDRMTQTGIWWYNQTNAKTWYSAEVFRIYGLAPFSLNAHLNTFLPFIQSDDREIVHEFMNRSLRQHTPLHIEYRINTPTGEKFVQHISQWNYTIKGESVMTGMIRDITETKAQEKALKDAEHHANFIKHQLSFDEESNAVGHWYLDLITRKSFFSNNYYRLFGLKSKSTVELTGFYEYVHPDDRQMFREATKKMLLEHTVPEFDFRIYRSDGKLRFLRQKARLYAGDGDLIMMGSIQDISVEVQLKNKIRELSAADDVKSFTQRVLEDLAGAAGWIWNINDNSITWSEGFYNLLGLKPGTRELSQKLFFSFVHPEDQKFFKGQVDLLVQQKTENIFEFRIQHWGKTRHIKAAFRRMQHQGDELFIAVFDDITRERSLEEDLNQRVQLANAVSENILDRMLITDIHHTIRHWNKSSEDTYGIQADHALGKNFFDIFPKLRTDDQLALFNRVLKGERICVKSMRSVMTAGFHDLHLLPMWDSQRSEVVGIVHIVHDITHEHELQRNLSERFSFIESLVESSPDHIIALDRNMNYLIWNKKCEESYGLSKEHVIGKNVLEVFPYTQNTPAYERFRQVLKGDSVHLPATPHTRREVYLLPVKNEKQEIHGILWIEHDLSREIESEKRLKEQAQLLEAVFNAAGDGIILFQAMRDDEGHIYDYKVVLNNAVTQKWNGRSLIGENYAELFPSIKTTGLLDEYNRVMETGIPLDKELFYKGEGFQNWFRIKAVRLSGDQMVATAEDITFRKNAQDEFEKNLAILKNAEHLAVMGNWEYDIGTGTMTWSEGMYRIFHLPPKKKVYPELYLELAADEDRATAEQIISHLKKEPRPFEVTIRVKIGDERRLLRIKASVVNDDNNRPQKIIGVDLDVTDMHRAEERLRESQHWLEQTTKISPDAITVYDLKNKQPIYLNNCLHDWLGIGLDQLIQIGMEGRLKLVHSEDKGQLLQFNERLACAPDGEVLTLEYRLKTNEDKWIWIRNRSKVFQRDTSGTVTHTLSILQNVTEEVVLRQELRRRSQYAESVIDASIDRIAVYDRELKMIAWNRCSEEATGRKREDVVGQKLFDVFPRVALDDELLKAHMDALNGSYITLPARKGVYSNRYYDRFFIPLKNDRDETYAVVIIMHDVSTLVLRNEQLDELNKTLLAKNEELEEKNEEITSFAFVASHDMKEPLRKIRTFSDFLLDTESEWLSANGKNIIKKLDASVRRMQQLIEDILVLTKIHSDKNKEEEVDLNQMLVLVTEDMAETIRLSGAVINSENLPVVRGNSNQIFYLLKNLISNGIKFQKTGNVPEIKISAEQVKENQGEKTDSVSAFHKISFRDNGFGFDNRYKRKIFQVFQRLHGRDEFDGTGIGLAICKKIMENHDGWISGESEPGAGSIFICYFPLH